MKLILLGLVFSTTAFAHCSKFGWVKTPYGKRCMVPTPKKIKPFKVPGSPMKNRRTFRQSY